MAKHRKNLFRKAYVTIQEADWSKYHDSDRVIRWATRKRKRECFQKFTEKVNSGSTGEREQKGLGSIFRMKNGYRKKNLQYAPLDPAEFTRFTVKIVLPRGLPIFRSDPLRRR